MRDIVCLKQVHGTDNVLADEKDKGAGTVEPETAIQGDSMILLGQEIGSFLFYADCVPITLIEIQKKIIVSVHAGWKGTIKRITKNVIRTLKNDLQINPQNLKAYIWPSIRSCCYQVSQKRYKLFIEELPFSNEITSSDNLDLALINKWELIEAGLSDSNIEISDICTSCRNDMFFSFRADNGNTGRQSLISYIPKKSNHILANEY